MEDGVLGELPLKENGLQERQKSLTKKESKARFAKKYCREFGIPSQDQEGKNPLPVTCKCSDKSKTKCARFDAEDRKKANEHYWGLTKEGKKTYMNFAVKEVPVKRRSYFLGEGNESRVKCSREYYLKREGTLLQVCRSFFLKTLNITTSTIYTMSQKTPTKADRTSAQKTSRTRKSSPKVKHAKNFLRALHTLPSHFCRKNTTRRYLKDNFRSKEEVYRAYRQNCVEAEMDPITSQMFGVVLRELKISIFKPRKDMCNICFAFSTAQNNTVSKEKFEDHTTLVKVSQTAKDNDRKSGSAEIAVFSFDKQAILQAPLNQANLMYYKSKLNINNLTIMEMRSSEVSNFLWTETEADNSSSVFASIHYNFFETFCKEAPKVTKLITWSDNCCFQNKSSIIASAFILLACRMGITVEQKFLVVGHTMMEVDSAHARIEQAKKGKDIGVPDDYLDIIRNARIQREGGPPPYTASMLTFDFFDDYREIAKMICPSLRPSVQAGMKKRPTVNQIHCLKYSSDSSVMYKLCHDDDWTRLPTPDWDAALLDKPLPKLFQKPIPLSKSKFEHLMQLKAVTPSSSWEYYDKLPVKSK